MEYDFVEVIKQFDRMCQRLGQMHCDPKECPISALIDLWERANDERWDDHCLNFAREWPDRFAKEVMKWANTHDEEPIYPTIGEVLNKICTLMSIDPKTSINTIYDEHLTEEVAREFNIEPINKNKLV